MPTQAKPGHITVISRTGSKTVAPPAVTVSAFIGAAQGKLSLGLTKTVPGMQTLKDAIAQGPAAKVPSTVLTALEAYMKTSQCAATISNARLVAEFTIAKLSPNSTPAPKLAAPATLTEVSAASNAAASQVPPQRKDVSTHDKVTAVNAVLSTFAPEAGGPLEALNQVVYAIWGDDGVNFVFGSPLPPPPSSDDDPPSSDNSDGGHFFPIQTIYDTVSNLSNSNGTGSSNQDPSHSDQGPTTDQSQH